MDLRESLPDVTDAENPIVWCPRCQRSHRRVTFTRGDYDQCVAEAVDALAAEIDRRALEAYDAFYA